MHCRIWYSDWDKSWYVQTPYHKEFIRDIKLIGKGFKTFNKEIKAWVVPDEFPGIENDISNLIFKHFHTRPTIEEKSQQAPTVEEEPIGTVLVELFSLLDKEDFSKAMKSAMLRHHPDKGGTNEKAAQLNGLYEKVKGHFWR